MIRTIIPARGRKLAKDDFLPENMVYDKNHNPRKGTETACDRAAFLQVCGRDKNHNPRKGTETRITSYFLIVIPP